MKRFYSFCFRLFGWKLKGAKPDLKKYIIIVAPHTSNWDFFVGLAARSMAEIKSQYLAKKSLFVIPIVGWFMRSVGGHPVDRSKRTNLVDQVVDVFNAQDEFVITITPEGTRSYNPEWKTGFYRIAAKAGVPIVMVAFDYQRKEVVINKPMYVTGDLDADIEKIKAYYRTIPGKYPEKGVV